MVPRSTWTKRSAWTSPSMVTLYWRSPANGVLDWAVAAVRVAGQAGLQTPNVSAVEVPPVTGHPAAQETESTSDEGEPVRSIWRVLPPTLSGMCTEATDRLTGAPGAMATV